MMIHLFQCLSEFTFILYKPTKSKDLLNKYEAFLLSTQLILLDLIAFLFTNILSSMSATSSQQISPTPLPFYQPILTFIQAEGPLLMLEHIIVLYVIIRLLIKIFSIESRGKLGLVPYLTKLAIRASKKIPFVHAKIEKYLETEAIKSIDQALAKKTVHCTYGQLPQEGLPEEKLLSILDDRKKQDIDPKKGGTFAYVYDYSKSHQQLTEKCFQKYIHSNALNPFMFNSLRVIENQVVKMTSTLFHGDDKCVGNVTSCGTQSLLLAMKTYRDWRGKGEVIMCVTGHPGINKGCHYVGLDVVQIPVDQNMRMSLKHLKRAISSRTVVVICSAPQYPHGKVDDVPQIAKICKQYGVPLHVDSAIGGYILPFIEMEGRYNFKPWDFRVDGVTSINADTHKYGYSPKGSSVLIFRDSTIRRNQYFSFATWPGGIYISPTAMGTRNGGCLSSAWGSLLGLGVKGFRESTRKILECRDKLIEEIKRNEELELITEPDSSIISYRCKNFSVYQFSDTMEKKGFFVEKQLNPESLHMTIMPQHYPVMDGLIKAIQESVEEMKLNPDQYEKGSKAMYGMVAKIPDENLTEDFVIHYMDQVYRYR